MTNLELVTGTTNVNHAHDMWLYTFDLKVTMFDTIKKITHNFRSLRELSRFLNVSINYIRPRIISSTHYPIFNRYILKIDYDNYINYISTIKNNKRIYVYCHVYKKSYVLTSYVQVSILFGISYINVARNIIKQPNNEYYIGGYTFSTLPIKIKHQKILKMVAFKDRINYWNKIAMNTKNVGLKRVGIESLKSKQ